MNTSHLTPHEAICDAAHRMVQALDENDPTLLASAFTENATYDLRPFAFLNLPLGLLTSRSTIVPSLLSAVGPMDTTHTLSNFRTRISTDHQTAHMTCYAYAQHFRPGQGRPWEFGNGFLMGNRYEGDLVWDGQEGVWRFERFRLWCVWSWGDFGVWDKGSCDVGESAMKERRE